MSCSSTLGNDLFFFSWPEHFADPTVMLKNLNEDGGEKSGIRTVLTMKGRQRGHQKTPNNWDDTHSLSRESTSTPSRDVPMSSIGTSTSMDADEI